MSSRALACAVAILSTIAVLMPSQLSMSAAAEFPATKIKIINDFETCALEPSRWGGWTSWIHTTNGNGVGQYNWWDSNYYHGLHCVRLRVFSSVFPSGDVTTSSLRFQSNLTMGVWPFDSIAIHYLFNDAFGPSSYIGINFTQYDATGSILSISNQSGVFSSSYMKRNITPIWEYDASYFSLNISLIAWDGSDATAYIDFFTLTTGRCDVRIRFWNLYSGFGYYGEKLRVRYYDSGSWVDVWQNGFLAYKYDSVLVRVTDIFDRYVYLGFLDVDSDPKYLDLLVPIITVIINKPADWGDVPFEWRITNLPWGPDGPFGMELPAIGFELEVLAGWYNFAWAESKLVEAGSQTIYIDGNLSEHRAYTLSNITIPLKPDTDVTIPGPSEDVRNLSTIWNLIVRFFKGVLSDPTMQVIFGVSAIAGALVWVIRAQKKAEEIAQKAAENVAEDQAKKEARRTARKETRRLFKKEMEA